MKFDDDFRALTGNAPFPWQRALYELFMTGSPPESCNLPTGLGKTSVIAIWLLALANQGRNMPRRLVYVVNRRTVVDQATNEAENLRKRLLKPEDATTSEVDRDVLRQIAKALRKMTAIRDISEDVPLAISTLRGQFADNREWSADPSRPAIILGTVDMIGSRLLFSGYGLGFKSKPLHAGFLGQDALLVHDEAHLEPAFQCLLLKIKKEQARCNEYQKLHVMELSATSRGKSDQEDPCETLKRDEVFSLSEEDRETTEIKKRIHATKTIHLHENDPKKLPERLSDLAIQHEGANSAVLVFARKVEDVLTVAKDLEKRIKDPERVRTLTGTMRGLERDKLVDEPIFQRFLAQSSRKKEVSPAEGTVYLVCTSAGEVGVNISANHLVCDLSTYESMAQRFGRVNRFGVCDDTRIDIVYPKEIEEKDEDLKNRLMRTLELLRQLNGDGSPAALDNLDKDARSAAFGPQPTILPVSDILFDAWALTTIRDKLPGRPPVEPYLHGEADPEPPQTHITWREEVGVVTDALLDQYKPQDLLDDYPIKPHELLRDRSDRVFKHLQSLAKKSPDAPVWLIDNDGTVEYRFLGKDGAFKPLTLGKLVDKDGKDRINNRTILLPPAVNGLRGGLLTGNPADDADDVADQWFDKTDQRRIRVWDDEDSPKRMRLIRTIDTTPEADEPEDESSPRRFWSWFAQLRSAEDDFSKTSDLPVTWDDHTNQVTDYASRIAQALDLPLELQNVIQLAAKFHDLGKKRELWQRSIGNPKPTDWHAKSGKDPITNRLWKPVDITAYRHEFGSLLDLTWKREFLELDEDDKDLVLHLIAAHHGHGRPHFPSELVFDPTPRGKDVGQIAREIPGRFARLQRKYGRWGLAYLESLLRAADYAASANPQRRGSNHE